MEGTNKLIRIDEILDMLDWNNSQEIQAKGVSLGSKVDDLSVFLQPVSEKHKKNVWDNCALILDGKSDEELAPYLPQLLEWLQDLNWPGTFTIIRTLKEVFGPVAFALFCSSCSRNR